MVMMLMGENPRVVARRVDEELTRIAATLPPGVEIETYYDRNDLVARTIATVQRNLVEGGLLVIAVLLLFLGNLRGGLIVAAAIPLSMLFAFTGMVQAGIAVQAWRLPSVALSESIKSTTLIEQTLLEFPEVVTVVSRTGQAEIPTDPMGIETSDVYAILTDQDDWETADTRDGLIEAMNRALERRVPGNIFSYSQPIELRMQEMIAGVRSDLAITAYGPDLDELRRIGEEIAAVVAGVPGAADVKAEQTAGLPSVRVRVDRGAIARYGINAAEVLAVVEAMGGTVVGEVLEGQARFPLQVRFGAESRADLEGLRSIRVATTGGRVLPLSQLAEIRVEGGCRPDQPRADPAPAHGGGQRPRSRPRPLRHRRAGRGRCGRRPATRLLAGVRRAVREPGAREPASGAGRAARPVPDLPAALHRLRRGPAGAAHLLQHPHCGHGRHPGAVRARHAVQHLGRHRLHRALGRGGAQRGGDAVPRPRPAAAGAAGGGGGAPGRGAAGCGRS